MLDQVLTAAKIGLLGLLYLFFLRVIKAVWVEVATLKAAVDTTGSVGTKSPRGQAQPTPMPNPQQAGAATSAVAAVQSAPPALRKPTAVVVVEPPQIAGRSLPLAGEISVGRDSGSTFAYDDGYLSQKHALLRAVNAGIEVIDLDSTNGTFVNGARIHPTATARVGDRIRMGTVELEVR